jgi:hypothetical protein
MAEKMVKGAVCASEFEDGEISGGENPPSQNKNLSSKQPRRSRIGDLENVVKQNYSELTGKFDQLFNLINERLTQSQVSNGGSANTPPRDKDDDILSIRPKDDETQFSEIEISEDEGENIPCKRPQLSEKTRQCLHEIFQDDALLKKPEEIIGIDIEESQKEILSHSYRAKKPNEVTAYAEDYKQMFPASQDTENFLKVPQLDDIIDECLKRQHGSKCGSFSKRGRSLFSQPDKMVEKTAFRGQHAANMGIVINLYMQQALGMLLNMLETEEIGQIEKKVRDTFSLCTKSLDQLGRVGAFFHIIRRQVTMHDTGLFKLDSSSDISSIPLNGEGVLGHGLDDILKERKEVKKTLDELLPESKFRKLKRKMTSTESDSAALSDKKVFDKPEKDFRIPKVATQNKTAGGKIHRNFDCRTSHKPGTGKGRDAKPKDRKQ